MRRAAKLLDELQADIFAEDWDLIGSYPNAFRGLVPVFTKYTDAAFPGDDVSMKVKCEIWFVVTRTYRARMSDEQPVQSNNP